MTSESCTTTAVYGYVAFTEQFTGKERDAETGLDYFGARYMSAAQGRFTSPDAPFADQHPSDPQSWNLYAYGRNNPMAFVDPTGNAVELVGSEEERNEILKRFQGAIGDKSGQYLYVNEHKGKFYVGVYENGKDGKQKSFSDALGSATAKELAGAVASKDVAGFRLGDAVQQGNQVRTLGPSNPGETTLVSEGRTMTTLARSSAVADLPASVMANGLPGKSNAGFAVMHELGHALGMFDLPRYTVELNKLQAVDSENRARRLAGAPIRAQHDPNTVKRFGR